MEYNFLDSSVDTENINLPEAGCINKFLLKNNYAEIIKAVDFFNSDDILLYVHGFLGTGKRQFINYVSEFINKDVIKLEYYCKASTVCDDILISFIDVIEKNTLSKAVNINAKVTTLSVKLQQYISSIKKPFVIILHSYDDISAENNGLVIDFLEKLSQLTNVKIIASTRAMTPGIFGSIKVGKKVFLKAFSKDIFREFISSYQITGTDTVLEDFYKYTRGYYYYTALSLKIVQAMKAQLGDFLGKFAQSGMSFDSYLGLTYINMVPATIRNFFWFLRTVRHGLTLNALAVFELYDEFSLEYLKNNLMIFQVGETVYVQDYFQQNIDISIPAKTEIKLHKYIINIYEKQLKEPLQTREIMISRHALRAEIEYHNKRIAEIESGKNPQPQIVETVTPRIKTETIEKSPTIDEKFKRAKKLAEEKKNTGKPKTSMFALVQAGKEEAKKVQSIKSVSSQQTSEEKIPEVQPAASTTEPAKVVAPVQEEEIIQENENMTEEPSEFPESSFPKGLSLLFAKREIIDTETIKIPREFHQELKILSTMSKVPMMQMLGNLLEAFLEENKKEIASYKRKFINGTLGKK